MTKNKIEKAHFFSLYHAHRRDTKKDFLSKQNRRRWGYIENAGFFHKFLKEEGPSHNLITIHIPFAYLNYIKVKIQIPLEICKK